MKVTKWMVAAALVCSPLVFTSCTESQDNPVEQPEETVSAERTAFEKQLSAQLQQLAQEVKFESAMESTQAIGEFVAGIDQAALKEQINLFLAKTIAGASFVKIESLAAQDKQAVALCLKERFKMTDAEIAQLPGVMTIDANKALNTLHVTFKDGKCELKNDQSEGFCIENVKPDGKTSKMVMKFGGASDGVNIFATRIEQISNTPLAIQLPKSFDIALTTAKGKVMNGTVALSTKGASRYLSLNKNQWDAQIELTATVNGKNESIALDASYEEDGHFDVNGSINIGNKQVLGMGIKGVKEPYSEEYLGGEEMQEMKGMGPIFTACYTILKTLKGKTVDELYVTFGGELEFKGSCKDVAKTVLALGNLYKLRNTNPSLAAVDAYTQELNKYVPFTVIQHSTDITAQGTLVTIKKGINHEEYQPAVALTFKGESKPQVMLDNMSEADRENYNKLIGNFNTLIQGCDKLLGSIVEKVREIRSTIKL